jgi:hypothetical protein
MVVRNQEVGNALQNYIKTFDNTNFPKENVPTACLHLKAVACTLGDNDFPTNVVRKVLEDFAKSSTTHLKNFVQVKLSCVVAASIVPS